MAVPDFQSLMRPVLQVLSDRKEHRLADLQVAVADFLHLPSEDRLAMLNDRETILANRVRWAAVYLGKAMAVAAPRRGVKAITDRGMSLLRSPEPIGIATLRQFPEFVSWRQLGAAEGREEPIAEAQLESSSLLSPEEEVRLAIARVDRQVRDELLDRLRDSNWAFFERIVLDVLRGMGYAGAKGKTIPLGGPGDGGVDGVIERDPLGLDSVYVQAKHFVGPVGSPDVTNFVGALSIKKATKGVFITTSTFSGPAIVAARKAPMSVALIDGERLAALMVEYEVGVGIVETYKLKAVDSDYFESSS